MLIRVVRFRGRPPDTATEASFTQRGGTIGRSSQCTLHLSDPERHISRIQAEINWTGTEYVLIDRGSAHQLQRNGEALSSGQAVPLCDGDELHVGDYVLRVEMPSASSGTGRTRTVDPFADLLPPPEEASIPAGHPLGPAAKPAGALIPDDFDPFGKSALAPGTVNEQDTGRFPSHHVARPEENLDLLFGLSGETGRPEDIGSPLAPPASAPNTAAAPDPFAALQSRPPASAAAVPDHAAEIHSPMPLPRIQTGGAFRSWESPDGAGSSAIAGGTLPRAEEPPGLNELPPTERRPAENDDEQGAFCRNAAAGPASPVALLEALLAGAGLRELPPGFAAQPHAHRQLDEQTMQRIGNLLRLFSQGAIDLLTTRTTLKKEMRSAMTVIAAQGNNPLKFSPDATTALMHLLAARTLRGFMAPEAAVQDAMNDLVAHQVGVISGMRAALQGLLQRFQPAELEGRLSSRSVLDSMLPMNRKAKLWEQFENTFNEVSKEAEEDFDALFSREFVRAYEEQIRALGERDIMTKPER